MTNQQDWYDFMYCTLQRITSALNVALQADDKLSVIQLKKAAASLKAAHGYVMAATGWRY